MRTAHFGYKSSSSCSAFLHPAGQNSWQTYQMCPSCAESETASAKHNSTVHGLKLAQHCWLVGNGYAFLDGSVTNRFELSILLEILILIHHRIPNVSGTMLVDNLLYEA